MIQFTSKTLLRFGCNLLTMDLVVTGKALCGLFLSVLISDVSWWLALQEEWKHSCCLVSHEWTISVVRGITRRPQNSSSNNPSCSSTVIVPSGLSDDSHIQGSGLGIQRHHRAERSPSSLLGIGPDESVIAKEARSTSFESGSQGV